MRTRKPAKNPALTDTELTTAWQAASLLLGYPDQELLDRRPLLRQATGSLPEGVAGPLNAFLDHLDATPPQALAADYVATFDHRKRCCLYLTYYAYGDTRKRGMALLKFKNAYRTEGLVLDDGELPDHLAVVLEFGATADPRQGRRLLLEHRAGLELLRLALDETDSPWTNVLDAVSATLPALTGSTREAVTRLVAQGPPEEEVGLAPFDGGLPGDSGGGPGAGSGGGPVFLPTPRVGARS